MDPQLKPPLNLKPDLELYPCLDANRNLSEAPPYAGPTSGVHPTQVPLPSSPSPLAPPLNHEAPVSSPGNRKLTAEVDLNIWRVGVVGLGYVGLPTALAFHGAGFDVVGVDVSERVVASLTAGQSPLVGLAVEHVLPVASGRWKVGSGFALLSDRQVILITVPTPVTQDKEPDLTFVASAARSVLASIRRQQNVIVILESTVYPGVTRRVLGAICQDLGLEAGSDVTLAYCPERVDPGTRMQVGNIARIVGCDDDVVGHALAAMYAKTTTASSTYVGRMEVAEAAKMVENLQRDVNIALTNELATVLPHLHVDVEVVLAAAATKWNFRRFTPGIGVGGHCIPIDPYYYIRFARDHGIVSTLAASARQVNDTMPYHAARSILTALAGRPGKALILGYSYKANVGDIRETPVQTLADALAQGGTEPHIHDPLVPLDQIPSRFKTLRTLEDAPEVDVIVLATAHDAFLEMDWDALRMRTGCAAVYDGRRALNPRELEEAGWTYMGIGVPQTGDEQF